MKLRFFEWRLNMYSSEYKIQRKAIQSIDITETDRTYVVCLNTSYGPISIYNPGTKISILALLPSLDEFKNYVFQSIVLSNDDIITIHTTFYITDLALKYISEIIYDPDTCGMQLEFYVHLTNVIGSTKLYMSDRNTYVRMWNETFQRLAKHDILADYHFEFNSDSYLILKNGQNVSLRI